MCVPSSVQKPRSPTTRDAHKPRGSAPINWLDDLDQKAKSFVPAVDWDEHPAFVFVRYPRLKPRNVPRSDHKEFSQILAKWHKRVSEDPQASCTITDLTGKNQQQLAALVLDTVLATRTYQSLRSKSRWGCMIRAARSRQERMLNRKVEAVLDALEGLYNYSMKLEDPQLGEPTRDVIRKCLRLLGFNLPLPFRPLVLPDKTVQSPLDESMVKLYCFFRYGCKISGHEAEVRVAIIRNAFWTQQGIARVSYRAEYEHGESKGCPAVRQAIRRFSKARGTFL